MVITPVVNVMPIVSAPEPRIICSPVIVSEFAPKDMTYVASPLALFDVNRPPVVMLPLTVIVATVPVSASTLRLVMP
jgi:hypothetical protein